jgi:hypothetical protein
MVDLGTTNLLLGIMAVVSVLEALVLIGAGIAGYRMYRTAMDTIHDLERRQIAPLTEKVNAILADVQEVTARVSHQTERVDHAISGTIDRVDETAERVKIRVWRRAQQALGIVRGIRAAVASVLNGGGTGRRPPHAAPGRA